MTLNSHHVREVTFVLSSGRTGTYALAQYLNQCSGKVTALHEPSPSYSLRIASSRYLSGRCSREFMIETLYRKRNKLFGQIQTPIYVESNPFLFGFLDVLGEVFHKPKVLHIVRDPRTMVRSALNYGSRRGMKWLAAYLIPYWRLSPELMEQHPKKSWREMSAIEHIAWRWKTLNSHLDRGAELYGTDYRRVLYEDLFSPDGSGLVDLAKWISVEAEAQSLAELVNRPQNRSVEKTLSQWDLWPESDQKALLEQCQELMIHYGYEVDEQLPLPREAASDQAKRP